MIERTRYIYMCVCVCVCNVCVFVRGNYFRCYRGIDNSIDNIIIFSSQMIAVSWSLNTVWIDVFYSAMTSLMTFQISNSFTNLEAEMTNRFMTVNITWVGIWRSFLCSATCLFSQTKICRLYSKWSCITKPQRKCLLFISLIRLHVIDIFCLSERNTITNTIPLSTLENQRILHSSLSQQSPQFFVTITTRLKNGTSCFKCLSLLRHLNACTFESRL